MHMRSRLYDEHLARPCGLGSPGSTHRCGLHLVAWLAAAAMSFMQLAVAGNGLLAPKYGIGALFVQRDSTSAIVLARCLHQSPAESAGLLSGDTLLALDGIPVTGWIVPRVTEYLLVGQPGPVVVTVRRGSSELDFRAERALVSEILAEENLRAVPSDDSTSTLLVPLHETRQLGLGEAVPPLRVLAADCSEELLSLRGSVPTLLYFWATWCKPCKELIGRLRSDPRAEREQEVRLIGINLDTECGVMSAALGELAPPGQQFWGLGPRSETAQLFRTYRSGIPCGVLVTSDGFVSRIAVGTDSIMGLLERATAQHR